MAGSEGVVQTSTEAVGGEGATSDNPRSLHGVLLDLVSKRPLPGRRVRIGQKVTMSDDLGRFELDAIDETYDLVISETNGSVVSIYRGLTRRDPIVLHHRSTFGVEGEQSAWIRGALTRAGHGPLNEEDPASVQFFSPLADARILLGGQVPPFGPNYSLFVQWRGSAQLKGTVFARASGQDENSMTVRPLTLQSGDEVALDLELSAVQRAKVAGTVTVPTGATLTQIEEYYRLPLPNAVMRVNDVAPSNTNFEHELDDLTETGGLLCIAAVAAEHGSMRAERCGIQLGASDVSLTLHPAPALSAPPEDARIESETQFSWTAFDTGIHRLALEVSVPTATSPNLYVYTRDTQVTWSSLASYGAPAQPTGHYTATIGGFGPFQDMDDAVGAEGLGALIPVEQNYSESSPVELLAAP